MSEIIENGGEATKKERLPSDCDAEYDPHYKPIISLPEVEVSTNEENETEILKLRAKLYRYDSSGEPAEWKERGTGEMKLLRHKENNSIRLVMRRDKTLKVCANHFITPMMELNASVGTDKAFVYTVLADFADEKPKRECLAIRFATVQNANLFKEKFSEAKAILLKECNLYNGKCDEEDQEESSGDEEEQQEADEVSEQLNNLSVKEFD